MAMPSARLFQRVLFTRFEHITTGLENAWNQENILQFVLKLIKVTLKHFNIRAPEAVSQKNRPF